jgi:hypothetical protein
MPRASAQAYATYINDLAPQGYALIERIASPTGGADVADVTFPKYIPYGLGGRHVLTTWPPPNPFTTAYTTEPPQSTFSPLPNPAAPKQVRLGHWTLRKFKFVHAYSSSAPILKGITIDEYLYLYEPPEGLRPPLYRPPEFYAQPSPAPNSKSGS